MTDRAEDDPTAGNVAFRYRDLGRAEGDADGVPFATVCYRPVVAESPPVARLHGHTQTPETTAGSSTSATWPRRA